MDVKGGRSGWTVKELRRNRWKTEGMGKEEAYLKVSGQLVPVLCTYHQQLSGFAVQFTTEIRLATPLCRSRGEGLRWGRQQTKLVCLEWKEISHREH